MWGLPRLGRCKILFVICICNFSFSPSKHFANSGMISAPCDLYNKYFYDTIIKTGLIMKKSIFIVVAFIISASSAHAHGDISKLPDSVQVLQYKMQLYMKSGDLDLQNKLAMAHLRNNQLKEAKEQLEAVLDKDKKNFNALDGMGIVLFKQSENKKALRYLKKALSVNSEDVMVHVHLSLNYEKLNMVELAKKEMGIAKSLASDSQGLKSIEEEIEILTLSE